MLPFPGGHVVKDEKKRQQSVLICPSRGVDVFFKFHRFRSSCFCVILGRVFTIFLLRERKSVTVSLVL